MTDPLTLVFAALSAVTSGLLFLFRQLMVEKDKSYERLENDCEEAKKDFKADLAWLRGQLDETQKSQIATLNVISRAVETQGIGVQAILELLQATVDPNTPRSQK